MPFLQGYTLLPLVVLAGPILLCGPHPTSIQVNRSLSLPGLRDLQTSPHCPKSRVDWECPRAPARTRKAQPRELQGRMVRNERAPRKSKLAPTSVVKPQGLIDPACKH